MSSQIILDIGAVGIFTLKAPYDQLLTPNTSYSCQSIRKLSDIISEDIDPFEVYYQPYGISEEDYELDVLDDVCIISLLAGIGQWVYVPSTYVLKYPSMNGITYRTIMLGISLGALPDGFSLDVLKTEVGDLIYDLIGIHPSIREVVVSSEAIISKADHDTIQAARLAKVSISMSKAAHVRKLQADLTATLNKVTELETFIRTKLPIP